MVARSVTLSGKKTPCPHCPVSAAAVAAAVAAAAERLFNPTCWTEQPIVYNKLILFIAWWRVILRGAFILTTVYESTWLFSAASVSIYQILFKNSGVILNDITSRLLRRQTRRRPSPKRCIVLERPYFLFMKIRIMGLSDSQETRCIIIIFARHNLLIAMRILELSHSICRFQFRSSCCLCMCLYVWLLCNFRPVSICSVANRFRCTHLYV